MAWYASGNWSGLDIAANLADLMADIETGKDERLAAGSVTATPRSDYESIRITGISTASNDLYDWIVATRASLETAARQYVASDYETRYTFDPVLAATSGYRLVWDDVAGYSDWSDLTDNATFKTLTDIFLEMKGVIEVYKYYRQQGFSYVNISTGAHKRSRGADFGSAPSDSDQDDHWSFALRNYSEINDTPTDGGLPAGFSVPTFDYDSGDGYLFHLGYAKYVGDLSTYPHAYGIQTYRYNDDLAKEPAIRITLPSARGTQKKLKIVIAGTGAPPDVGSFSVNLSGDVTGSVDFAPSGITNFEYEQSSWTAGATIDIHATDTLSKSSTRLAQDYASNTYSNLFSGTLSGLSVVASTGASFTVGDVSGDFSVG